MGFGREALLGNWRWRMAVKRKEGKRRVSIRGRTTKNKLQTFQQEVVMKVTVARVIEMAAGS